MNLVTKNTWKNICILWCKSYVNIYKVQNNTVKDKRYSITSLTVSFTIKPFIPDAIIAILNNTCWDTRPLYFKKVYSWIRHILLIREKKHPYTVCIDQFAVSSKPKLELKVSSYIVLLVKQCPYNKCLKYARTNSFKRNKIWNIE